MTICGKKQFDNEPILFSPTLFSLIPVTKLESIELDVKYTFKFLIQKI